NALNLVPANRKALSANLAMNQVKLETAKLDLEYTTVRAPFNCRITEVKIEKSQFVQKGQDLAGADGTDVAEIEAQISIDKMINLLKSVGQTASFARLDFKTLQDIFQLTARVRLKIGDLETEWDARFVRADATIDPQTRTVGIIVAVDTPYEKIQIGIRPPLVRNMFCEVELKGRPLSRKIIIPRSALHDGQVYTLNPQNRLVRNNIVIDFAQVDFYAVKEGLSEGQWLIVSDLVPAIDGMLLVPVEDAELSERLFSQASGTETIK
ncbi:efflux RND transporter periplasmic adaptor subunit, partial [Thermodesulfobacteriota bacterium]